MITAQQCFLRYGPPENEAAMVLWDVPPAMEIGVIPRKIYCNKELVAPLSLAISNLISRRLVGELTTWDGCFCIRKKRAGVTSSLHSWGIAVDVNASWNQLGFKPTLSKEFVQCFLDAGFEWGGNWQTQDGMHFQLAEFPA
jgi:hypothetical protein